MTRRSDEPREGFREALSADPLAEMPMLTRKTLHTETADLLRDLIVSGRLGPGQKVPEKDLCIRFGISRTPFREALKVLATEGLIELLPQRGARVNTITDEELNELFPIIASLEALAGETACAKATEAELHEVRVLHDEMLAAYRQRDYLEYARLNRAIHLTIMTAARNQSLNALYRNLELRIRNIRHTVEQTPEDWAQAVAEHEEILQALIARDAGALSQVLRRHVMNTAAAVRRSIDELIQSGVVDPEPGRATQANHSA